MRKNSGPLSGVKVVEFAHVMAGPVCGLMLADMGADVIKVEKLPGGDDSRRFVPPQIKGESAAFMMVNRNKRGMAINLKHPKGRKVAHDIIDKADILIENFRSGTMERLGLGYPSLKKTNPALIYCEISGFGRTGPYKDRAGFDLVAQGMSGLMSITGEGGERPFVKVGAPITDISSGILAAMGVLAAYIERLKTGKGQRVETSLFEAGIVQTYWQSAISLATGVSPKPLGSAHPLNAPYQAYKTKDGWITVGAANQKNWIRLLGVLETPALAEKNLFKNNSSRMKNLSKLNKILDAIFREKNTHVWLRKFDLAGIPSGPVLTVDQMHNDPHVIDRNMIVSPIHTLLGPTKAIGCPVKFSKSKSSVGLSAPLYGEHTQKILREIGYKKSEVERLIASEIIA